MATPDTLGKRIAQARRELSAREERDVTLAELGEAAGVTAGAISLWEADKRPPREEALAKLAVHLGVSLAYLRYGIPDDHPTVAPDPSKDRRVTPGERAAAKRVVDAATPRRKRGNNG